MTAKHVFNEAVEFSQKVTTAYLSDMSDADLLVRPVPGANHIAWQLGHLIASAHEMGTMLGHKMPELPAGFAAAYSAETAKSDDPAGFAGKDEYLALLDKMRAAAKAAVDATPEADLGKPAPEPMREYAPTIGAALLVLGLHELMHAGQWAVVRRKLGKPVLF